MKKFLSVLMLLLTAGALLAACGGDDPLTEEDLAAAADEICTENNALYDDFGVRGLTNTGLVAEFEATKRVRQQFADDFEALDVDDSVTDWDRYVELSRELVETDQAIVDAAAADDDEAVGEAFATQTEQVEERDKLAKSLGFEVCSFPAEIMVEETGTGPAPDLEFDEPDNTVETAADEYLAAAESGDCSRYNGERHTDAGEVDETTCGQIFQALKGAEVGGTESYGPVAQAEIVDPAGTHYPTYFVTDIDGQLRYAGDLIHDSGGLRTAPEDNDADVTAEATVEAIRSGDSEAFNETLLDLENNTLSTSRDDFRKIGTGRFGGAFVDDIRSSEVVAEPLGINSTYAFYLVKGSTYDWVVSLIHVPGDQHQYRMGGFFPIVGTG